MSSRPPSSDSISFSRWPWWRRWFGLRSERVVAGYLRRKGMRILGQNVQDRRGEIDLLALDGPTLVIVEVRSSASSTSQQLAATVNYTKQKRLTEAALRFLQRRGLRNISVRFDVLTVVWNSGKVEPEIRHYPHAFEAVGKYQIGY